MPDEILQTASLVVEVDKSAVKPGMESVKHDFEKGAKEAEGQVSRIKKALEELKASAGKRSTLGETFELLRGAGAVAGVAIVGEVLKDAAEKAEKLNDEFRQGKIDAEGLASGILKSLPIIGSFAEAGASIREMFTHEKAQIEDINKATEAGNALAEARKAILEQTIKGEESLTAKTTAANNAMRSANARNSIERATASTENEKDTRHDNTDKEVREYAEAQREKLAEAVKASREKLKADQQLNRDSNADDVDQRNAALVVQQNLEEKGLTEKANAEIKSHEAGLRAADALSDKAADKELARLKSGQEEAYKIRAETADRIADTTSGKLENFRAEKQHEGFEKPALDLLEGEKAAQLHAEAVKGSKDALIGLNQQFADSEATTFDEKIKANRQSLEEEARTGKITKESIDDLSNAYAKILHADVDKALKDAAIALADVGKTNIETQVEALQRMGANAQEAAKYAADLKATLTGNDIKGITNQLATVGQNPLDKARTEANQRGEDGNAVAQAQGKLLGAQLTNELKSPLASFQDAVNYYKELLAAGDISNKTFLVAQQKAFDQLVAQTTTSDIDSAARAGIARSFAGAGIVEQMQKGQNGGIPAVNAVNAKKDADDKKKAADAKDNSTKAIDSNTEQLKTLNEEIKELNDTLANGLTGTYG